jgi:hypothetical protein
VTRGAKALAAVGVVVLLVALGVRLLSDGHEPSPSTPTSSGGQQHSMPATPQDVPAEGMYVASHVTADGLVRVQAWLRTPTPIEELELTTTDPDLQPWSVESLDVVVRTLDGTAVARRDSVGTNQQRVQLREPASELYLSYTIHGAMDDASETVAGRSLARVLAMDVTYAGAGGVIRRLVTADGTVLNVACLHPSADFDASPRPCGRPTGDGDWTVDLRGEDWGDRLLAQIEA